MAKNLSRKHPDKVNEIEQFNPQTDGLTGILQDKTIKAKEKTTRISQLLLDKSLTIDELIETAFRHKDALKASLIEAIEYTSKATPEIVNQKAFEFVVQSLKDDAPRVKWEAAKVIANTAHLFPNLEGAVTNLLSNAEHSGNVVRWSTATALSKIIVLNRPLNKELIPAAEALIETEEDNAVKKIYLQALKKMKT